MRRTVRLPSVPLPHMGIWGGEAAQRPLAFSRQGHAAAAAAAGDTGAAAAAAPAFGTAPPAPSSFKLPGAGAAAVAGARPIVPIWACAWTWTRWARSMASIRWLTWLGLGVGVGVGVGVGLGLGLGLGSASKAC